MKRLLILIALFLSTPLLAGEFGIQFHWHSGHFVDRDDEDWNENMTGYALRYSFNDVYAVQAGYYLNEQTVRGHNATSNYVLGDYTPFHVGPVFLGAYGGLVDGYDDYTYKPTGDSNRPLIVASETNKGVNPFTGLVARMVMWKFNVTLRLQPDIPHAGPATLKTEVGVKF
jgi:hypothetical protein